MNGVEWINKNDSLLNISQQHNIKFSAEKEDNIKGFDKSYQGCERVKTLFKLKAYISFSCTSTVRRL